MIVRLLYYLDSSNGMAECILKTKKKRGLNTYSRREDGSIRMAEWFEWITHPISDHEVPG